MRESLVCEFWNVLSVLVLLSVKRTVILTKHDFRLVEARIVVSRCTSGCLGAIVCQPFENFVALGVVLLKLGNSLQQLV